SLPIFPARTRLTANGLAAAGLSVSLLANQVQRRTPMGYSRYDAAARVRAAWNAGKTVGTKRPLTQKQIWAIRFFLDRERRVRDRALFDRRFRKPVLIPCSHCSAAAVL